MPYDELINKIIFTGVKFYFALLRFINIVIYIITRGYYAIQSLGYVLCTSKFRNPRHTVELFGNLHLEKLCYMLILYIIC